MSKNEDECLFCGHLQTDHKSVPAGDVAYCKVCMEDCLEGEEIKEMLRTQLRVFTKEGDD